MKRNTRTKTYFLVSAWVIIATALGVYLTNTLTKPRNKDFTAPMAAFRQCGPASLPSDDQRKILTDWIIKPESLSADVKDSLVRVINSLPDGAIEALKKKNFKVALDRGDQPNTCSVYDKPDGRTNTREKALKTAVNCLKTQAKNSVTLVVGPQRLIANDGNPRSVTDKNLIDETLLPTIFWTLLEGLYKPADAPGPLAPGKPSIANISEQIKRYVVDSYKFSEGEQEFYHREFGAAGLATPAFATRTLVLTASNLYCSGESYGNLSKTQPEATKRFMSIYGCALGKPWHMTSADFSGLCPTVAKASPGVEK
jgi:hypothetical protein